MWPVPLSVLANIVPELPWDAVRQRKLGLARNRLFRLIHQGLHTNEQEQMEIEGAGMIDCFRGTNLHRIEIISNIPLMQLHDH